MSKRKSKKVKIKQEERRANNFKRNKYHTMALEGILGDQDIQKYSFMYESLNGQRDLFPSPNEKPTRKDYNRLKIAYNSLDSKL
jgi:hypothetical protein